MIFDILLGLFFRGISESIPILSTYHLAKSVKDWVNLQTITVISTTIYVLLFFSIYPALMFIATGIFIHILFEVEYVKRYGVKNDPIDR